MAESDAHDTTVKIDRSMVRIGATVLMTLVVAIFVQAHGALQANRLQYGLKFNSTILPLPTAFYHQCALAGYILPLAAAWLFVVALRARDGPSVRFEMALRVVGLLALLWALGAILAWELPRYYSIELVK